MEIIVTIVEKVVEKVLYVVGFLIGKGVSAAWEKIGAALPAGRPGDRIATARRMSREQKELYTLHTRLRRHEPQAQGIATDVCWGAVIAAFDPSPDDLTNPFVLAASQLCQDILRFEGYFPLPEIEGTHLRRDTVIPQWFQASKAAAASDGHAVHC